MIVQFDGGSNCHILTNQRAAQLSILTPASGFIASVSGGLTTRISPSAPACQLGSRAYDINFAYAPEGGRTITSESKLLDDHRIEVRKHPSPGYLLFPDGST